MDLSVPKEFDTFYKEKFSDGFITERNFVDLCLLAYRLLDDNWDSRFGFAYRITHAWLGSKNIEDDELLDTIGQEIGVLEIADDINFKTEDEVRAKWNKIKTLVEEADKKFS